LKFNYINTFFIILYINVHFNFKFNMLLNTFYFIYLKWSIRERTNERQKDRKIWKGDRIVENKYFDFTQNKGYVGK